MKHCSDIATLLLNVCNSVLSIDIYFLISADDLVAIKPETQKQNNFKLKKKKNEHWITQHERNHCMSGKQIRNITWKLKKPDMVVKNLHWNWLRLRLTWINSIKEDNLWALLRKIQLFLKWIYVFFIFLSHDQFLISSF